MFFLADTRLTRIFEATVWYWLAMAVVLFVLIVIVLRIKAWLHEDDDHIDVDHQMLQEITELQRRGELTSEEFRSIKGQLVNRLKLEEMPASQKQTKRGSPE